MSCLERAYFDACIIMSVAIYIKVSRLRMTGHAIKWMFHTAEAFTVEVEYTAHSNGTRPWYGSTSSERVICALSEYQLMNQWPSFIPLDFEMCDMPLFCSRGTTLKIPSESKCLSFAVSLWRAHSCRGFNWSQPIMTMPWRCLASITVDDTSSWQSYIKT